MDCSNDVVVIVGDDVHADVNGALSAGHQVVLVRTGKYRIGDEDQISDSSTVIVSDDVGDPVALILAI